MFIVHRRAAFPITRKALYYLLHISIKTFFKQSVKHYFMFFCSFKLLANVQLHLLLGKLYKLPVISKFVYYYIFLFVCQTVFLQFVTAKKQKPLVYYSRGLKINTFLLLTQDPNSRITITFKLLTIIRP